MCKRFICAQKTDHDPKIAMETADGVYTNSETMRPRSTMKISHNARLEDPAFDDVVTPFASLSSHPHPIQ